MFPMYEGKTMSKITAMNTVDLTNTRNEWYRKKYKEVISNPEKFTQWKVIDDRLYFLRLRPVVFR